MKNEMAFSYRRANMKIFMIILICLLFDKVDQYKSIPSISL